MAQFVAQPEGDNWLLQIEENGETASRLSVVPFRQRIGSAWVRMGGIAGVNTPPKHREKGYARQLLRTAVEWLTGQGYDWSGLFGIGDFYHKYGYLSALSETWVSVPVRWAERAPLHHSMRLMTAEDVPGVLDVYDAANAARTGTVERDRSKWRGFTKGTAWGVIQQAEVVLQGDAIAGYVVYDRYAEGVNVAEAAAVSLPAYESILARLAQLAVERRAERLRAYCPADHPFTRLCARYGCDVTVHYPYHRQGMWRILNLLPLCQAVAPEWDRRLRRAGWDGTAHVNLQTDLGEVSLRVQHGSVTVSAGAAERPVEAALHLSCQVSQAELAQSLMGFISLREHLEAAGRPLAEPEADLADILFPRLHPVLWKPDHF